MTRCKLISPTNLMLERPLLGPVEENEFFLLGVKEYQRRIHQTFWFGWLLGGAVTTFIFVMIAVVSHG